MALSAQSYEKVAAGNLQVNGIFTSLMTTATDKDSMYIKAKESMADYLADSNLSEREKATMLSDLISKLTIDMTGAAMDSAFKIAKENRDAPYTLSKANEDILMSMQQRDKVATDMELTAAQIKKMEADAVNASLKNWKDQAELYWKTGVDTTDLDPAVNLTLPATTNLSSIVTGTGYYDVEFGKTKQYELLSSSVRNYGVLGYTYDVDGNLATSTELQGDEPLATTSPVWNGLVKQQHAVAVRQETGFDDNMKQHAANSSANMIGLLLSSDFGGTEADYTPYLTLWTTAMEHLNSTT